MQKRVAYLGPRYTVSQVVAKSIAKRGHVLVECLSNSEIVNCIDENTIGVLAVSEGRDGNILDSFDAICDADNMAFVNKLVNMAVDYRTFVNKRTHYNFHNIRKVCLTQHAYRSCSKNITETFPLVQVDIVDSDYTAIRSLDEYTCAIAGVQFESRDLAMGASTLSDNTEEFVTYAIVSDTLSTSKLSNTIYFGFSVENITGSIADVAKILLQNNIDIKTVYTTRGVNKRVIIEMRGHIKNKIVARALDEIQNNVYDYKLIGNVLESGG